MACTQLLCLDSETNCPSPIDLGDPGDTFIVAADGSASFEARNTDLDIVNGTITYTRYDGTTVTFDACDDIVSNCPIGALSDVDTETVPPVAGDVLTFDGLQWVPMDVAAAACPAITLVSANDCTGGVGADDMIRNAAFNQALCQLTLNGAPEHTTISGTVDSPFVPVIPANGSQVIMSLQTTITNPSICRDMRYFVAVRPGRPAAVLGDGNRWIIEIVPLANADPNVLGTGVYTRFDNRFTGVLQSYAYPAGAEFYTGILAPGASITYGFDAVFTASDFAVSPNNQLGFGRSYISYIGSTV